jgi:transcriptional antiterminator RfaH
MRRRLVQTAAGPIRMTWYLAQYKPNAHGIAERNLRLQGFATFLPLQEETRRAGGRFRAVRRPLFPGYIFVAPDRDGADLGAVNSTLGVTRLVSLGRGPTPLPEGLVAELRQACDGEDLFRAPADLAPGARVAVARGPFASLVARVGEVTPDRRVSLLFDLLEGPARLVLPLGQLRPLGEG